MGSLEKARIFVVDDDAANLSLLTQLLVISGFDNVTAFEDSIEALGACVEAAPDIILLDGHMPTLSGLEFMNRLLGSTPDDDYLPVIFVSGDSTPNFKRKALAAGAADFLLKPFDSTEVALRVRNHLRTRFMHKTIRQQKELLDVRVEERTRELRLTQQHLIECLAKAAEYRDDDTGEHTRRVGRLSELIAQAMGLSQEYAELIGTASMLHDLGKIGIPDAILLKPGPLTEEELAIMRRHTGIGAEILNISAAPIMRVASEIARTHHHRWDGKDSPDGTMGEQIPLSGRIVAVADVFDALTHERPYKEAWPVDIAIAHIKRESGKQFDPAVVNAFLSIVTDYLDRATFAPAEALVQRAFELPESLADSEHRKPGG